MACITKNSYYLFVFLILIISLTFAGFHCATIGYLSKKYPKGFYKVRPLLSQAALDSATTFIVYSDTQRGWWVYERFFRKSNWTSWNMLLFPFYQLYLIGNGIVGHFNWFRHIPDFGGNERLVLRDAIYNEAKQHASAFILNVGDIVANDSQRPAHWAMFLEDNKSDHGLLNKIPYFPVIGNHEHTNDASRLRGGYAGPLR